MRKTVTVLAAAAILAGYNAPVLAQEASATSQPAATSPATGPNRTATTQTLPQSPAANYQQLMTALGKARSEIAQLRAMSNLTTNNLRIVKVQTLVTPSTASSLNDAIARNQAELGTLRQVLGSTRVTATTDNSQITVGQFLTDNKIGLNQVVAADVDAASLTLFIQ